jgi:hypothetical protein
MATYLLLLHNEGAAVHRLAAEEKQALFDRFVVWSEALKASGILRAVESLMDDGGTTLRKKRDVLVVDGPYAELKEMVNGLFVIDVDDAAEAHRIASQCPLLDVGGAVELRAIAPFPVRPD